MSMDKMTRKIIASGKWAQCVFCKRALPKAGWAASSEFNPMYKDAVIKENGYCTDCQKVTS